MKKISILCFLIIVISSFSACSETAKEEIITEPESTQETVEKLVPVFGDKIKNGTYEIAVESSSSMFRVVKCVLNVNDGDMTAKMTMSGQGYGKVYMGTSEEALNSEDAAHIPFVLNDSGEKTFTIPIDALNKEIDCAAYSIKKDKWYDRKLKFLAESLPKDAMITE